MNRRRSSMTQKELEQLGRDVEKNKSGDTEKRDLQNQVGQLQDEVAALWKAHTELLLRFNQHFPDE